MKRIWLTFLIPPMAVCRYGCAGCCAAPIGVMCIASLISIGYGLMGGPAANGTISWVTILLGVGLWILASIWAMTVIRNVDEDKAKCDKKPSKLCDMVSDDDDQDPLKDIKNLTN